MLRRILGNRKSGAEGVDRMKQIVKELYQAPLAECWEISCEGALLQGSVEKMNSVQGSWDNEEDW